MYVRIIIRLCILTREVLEHTKSISTFRLQLIMHAITILFFCGVHGSNFRPYIYYALSLPIELSLRGHNNHILHCDDQCLLQISTIV